MYLKMIVAFLAVISAVASSGLLGAPVDANMNDEGVQEALQFAKAQFTNHCFNDSFVVQILEVVKVQTQVSSLNDCFVTYTRNVAKSHRVSEKRRPLVARPAFAEMR